MRSLLLLAFLPTLVLAQGTGTIAGRVANEIGEPLPGANVV